MKTRWLVVTLWLFVLCSAATAQDFQIRADANINLRATYSLESAIVETVPAGSVLQVVGRFNRWLKIDRDGEVAWMADWVSYTRLTGTDQTQTRTSTATRDSGQTQSEIDNCCFVDRQCTVDADWVSGYWAFQEGQCPVPEQTRQQTPLQSTTTDTSQVNNCCYIGWQCSSDEEWAHGYRAFQIRQCKHRGVEIEGSEALVLRVEDALDLLRDRAPEWYAYVMRGLDKIREVPEGNSSGVYADTRTYVMPLSRAFRHWSEESSLISLAGGMVHEACHVFNWQIGLIDHSWQNELPCLRVQLEVTEAVDPRDRFSPWLRDLIANIENPGYWWWTT